MWSLYNPYIRVHPSDPNIVYFGGQKLYKGVRSDTGGFTHKMVVKDVWDHKTFAFDPNDSTDSTYYVLCDQGVFRGTVQSTGDTYVHRNSNLRVTQFFDVDCSPADASVMVGGTQDTGTLLLHQGSAPNWRMIRGSDGYHSLITKHVPGDQVPLTVWSQVQFMDSTAKSEGSLASVGSSWDSSVATGLPWGYLWSAYIARHPTNKDVLLSRGNQVYATLDGGATGWSARGPDPQQDGSHGKVMRVVIQSGGAGDAWIAGMTHGEIWYATSPGGAGTWSLMFSRPQNQVAVVSLALAPTDQSVLYVVFAGGSWGKRIARLAYDHSGGTWVPEYITDNFPITLAPLVIAGDGHSADVAYVGTSHGVWRWDHNLAPTHRWQEYNDGLPLTQVSDLLVDPSSKELRAGTLARGAWSVITGP
jgi:hypothetical protein